MACGCEMPCGMAHGMPCAVCLWHGMWHAMHLSAQVCQIPSTSLSVRCHQPLKARDKQVARGPCQEPCVHSPPALTLSTVMRPFTTRTCRACPGIKEALARDLLSGVRLRSVPPPLLVLTASNADGISRLPFCPAALALCVR